MTFEEKYTAFFGRPPDLMLEQTPDHPQSPSVYRYPPTRAGFLKRIFTPLWSDYVYMTAGMSRYEMSVPPEEQRVYPSRIELLACAKGAIVGGADGADVVTRFLQMLAVVPFEQGIFFGPLQTCDLGKNLSTNSEMTGVLFGVPDGSKWVACAPALRRLNSSSASSLSPPMRSATPRTRGRTSCLLSSRRPACHPSSIHSERAWICLAHDSGVRVGVRARGRI